MKGTLSAQVKKIGDFFPTPDPAGVNEKLSTSYHLVRSENLGEVHKRVNNLLARGWSLAGGVCAVAGPGECIYYIQALTIQLKDEV